MVKTIGQYRSKNDANIYSSKIVDDPETDIVEGIITAGILTSGTTGLDSELQFEYKALVFPSNVIKNKDYYVSFKIDRNIGHDAVYDIQLVTFNNNDNGELTYSKQYQHLRTVKVLKGASTNSLEDELLKVYAYRPNENNKNDIQITKQEAQANDCEGKPLIGYIDITEWQTASDRLSSTELVSFGFSPRADNFNGILIKKRLEYDDYRATWQDKDGNPMAGFETVITEPEFYVLNELINNEIDLSSSKYIQKLGIWGHSGLGFMINHEEIHIGARGYYELEYPVSSLSAICLTKECRNHYGYDYHNSSNEAPVEKNHMADKFLIDYEYTI